MSDEDFTNALVGAGVPQELADCIADKIEGEVDVAAIENGDAEATQELTDASADCALEAIESGEQTPEELEELGEDLQNQ